LRPSAEGIILVVHAIGFEMQRQKTTREAGATGTGAARANDRSRMFIALIVLLGALAVLLVKDRDFWFGDGDKTVAEETSPEWVPSTPVQPPSTPAVQAKKAAVAAVKSFAEPKVTRQPIGATARAVNPPAVIPPLEVEVIAGDTRDNIRLGSNPAKFAVPSGPATVAAQRVQMSLAKVQTPPPPDSAYPLLGRQMKVQGSVLLQALIGADGVIRDLRVLSGPAILASAAREAARRWQFKPYLEDGQPVETQAKIAVNFTIKVLENGARDQMDTVVALSSRGE
jgi:protein TonB